MADKFQLSPRELAGRVLGKAVDPRSVDSLFRLWPEAVVEVQHSAPGMERRFTIVRIWRSEAEMPEGPLPNTGANGQATCCPGDQFDRRAGIKIAFRRALSFARVGAELAGEPV